jgi:anti-anti-sigma factor
MAPEDREPVEFRIDATFAGTEAVLTVHGDIEKGGAFELGSFLDAAIELGNRFVVLNLAQVEFVDGTGLRAIGGAADQLAIAGGALVVRSPSPTVLRLLSVAGLGNLVSSGQPGESFPKTSSGLTTGLTMVTGLHSDNEVVDRALQLAVNLARATVSGADGASVSLRRRGRLSTVAASDRTIAAMDANQYATGEGPCIDASEQGRRFHAETLARETRWPTFTPRARSLGIEAILSSPLLVQDKPVGALNIYSLTPEAFAPKDQALASMFATEASMILAGVGVTDADDQRSSRFQNALREREIIAQAQGVLMERDGIRSDDAYTSLRRLSIGNNLPIHNWAERIVASTQPAEPGRGAPRSGAPHE